MSLTKHDIARRLRSLLPKGWFAEDGRLYHALTGGLGDSLFDSFTLLDTVRKGTRRATTTGDLLDVDAFGFLGEELLRLANESDDDFRARYLAEVLRPRGRRQDIVKAVTDLTGRACTIVEPWNPGDCGGWDVGTLAWSGAQVNAGAVGGYDSGNAGWGVGAWGFGVQATQSLPGSSGAGCWGSLEMPAQFFVTAHRRTPPGTPNVTGWGITAGGWDIGTTEWTGTSVSAVLAPDAEIYAAINRTKAAGTVAWTNIVA